MRCADVDHRCIGQVRRPQHATAGHVQDLVLQGDCIEVQAGCRDPKLPPCSAAREAGQRSSGCGRGAMGGLHQCQCQLHQELERGCLPSGRTLGGVGGGRSPSSMLGTRSRWTFSWMAAPPWPVSPRFQANTAHSTMGASSSWFADTCTAGKGSRECPAVSGGGGGLTGVPPPAAQLPSSAGSPVLTQQAGHRIPCCQRPRGPTSGAGAPRPAALAAAPTLPRKLRKERPGMTKSSRLYHRNW